MPPKKGAVEEAQSLVARFGRVRNNLKMGESALGVHGLRTSAFASESQAPYLMLVPRSMFTSMATCTTTREPVGRERIGSGNGRLSGRCGSCPGIVGLPNVGKSSLFNLLTQQAVAAENFPFCTSETPC
jgi:hypothetical protein